MEQMFNIPVAKHILRSTGEEVEVIDFEAKERGDRTEFDWVTYIDSEGKEHIKEKLNIQLDFKHKVNDLLQRVSNSPIFKGIPTERNKRIYEVAKELFLNNKEFLGITAAVNKAAEFVDAIGIEFEEK